MVSKAELVDGAIGHSRAAATTTRLMTKIKYIINIRVLTKGTSVPTKFNRSNKRRAGASTGTRTSI